MTGPEPLRSAESSKSKNGVPERVISGRCAPLPIGIPGVEFREFVSARCGAHGISTGTATFQPGSGLPRHKHRFSEGLTILGGEASCSVEGRTYRLGPFDCIHIPAGTAHQTQNRSFHDPLIALWVYAAGTPSSELVGDSYSAEDRGWAIPKKSDPEHIVRFTEALKPGASAGTHCCDLFSSRFGAVGIEGGYDEFDPGASLGNRVHDCDESVTILAGEAVCEVTNRAYRLSGCDTLFLPRGCEHRISNQSEAPMALIWARAAGL